MLGLLPREGMSVSNPSDKSNGLNVGKSRIGDFVGADESVELGLGAAESPRADTVCWLDVEVKLFLRGDSGGGYFSTSFLRL